jgi:glycosyltransferase involved in cell wall biosynthesis
VTRLEVCVLSVIIPTLNRQHLAARAVESALALGTDVEVIVVDDGSTPAFVPPCDSRVRLVRHETAKGNCGARNAGLAAARGEWVTFLDDDDRLLPNMAEVSFAAASRFSEPVAVLSGVEVVREDDSVVTTVGASGFVPRGQPQLFRQQLSSRTCNTLFAPTELIRLIGGFDPLIPSWVHTDLLVRLLEVCSLVSIQDVTYEALDHAGQRVHRNPLGNAIGLRRTLKKHPKLFAGDSAGRAHYEAAIGYSYMKAGHRMMGLLYASRAAVRTPSVRNVAVWLACVVGPHGVMVARWARTLVRGRT